MASVSKLVLVSTLLTGISYTSLASGESLDLLQTYHMALERDAQIAAAGYAADAGKEILSQSRSFLLPQFSISGSYGQTHSETNDSGFETRESYNAALNVRQALLNVGAIVAYKEADFMLEQSELNHELSKQDLILRVSESYFNVLSAEESVSVAQAQTTAFKESLERAKLAFKVGTATITDKLEAQARYDLAVSSEIASRNASAVAKQSLKSIIGTAPETLHPLNTDAVLPKIDPTDVEFWVEKALEKNHQLRMSNLGYRISEKEVSRHRAARYPTVDLVGRLSDSKQNFGSTSFETQGASVSVELNMPLFTGGFNNSKVRESIAQKNEQKETLENTRRQIALQTQQIYLAVENGLQQVLALQQAVASNKSALDATSKGLEVGVRTNLDLLNAQQQYFSTRRDYSVARYDYLLNVLKLRATTGELLESDIEEMNGLLEMASN